VKKTEIHCRHDGEETIRNQGLYVEHEAVKIYVETAKREAFKQLSLMVEQIHAEGVAPCSQSLTDRRTSWSDW
jgi:hypothetical protein